MNQEIIRVLINVTLFLGTNSLFCSFFILKLNNIGNNENFFNLVQMISKYSLCLAFYITELGMSSKKSKVNFISKLTKPTHFMYRE